MCPPLLMRKGCLPYSPHQQPVGLGFSIASVWRGWDVYLHAADVDNVKTMPVGWWSVDRGQHNVILLFALALLIDIDENPFFFRNGMKVLYQILAESSSFPHCAFRRLSCLGFWWFYRKLTRASVWLRISGSSEILAKATSSAEWSIIIISAETWRHTHKRCNTRCIATMNAPMIPAIVQRCHSV